MQYGGSCARTDRLNLASRLYSRLPALYSQLTLHVVPGPRSLRSLILPLSLLLILSLPRSVVPSGIARWVLLPALLAFEGHLWREEGSFSVLSVNGALMAVMLLGRYDPRRDLRRVIWEIERREKRVAAKGESSGGSEGTMNGKQVSGFRDPDRTERSDTGPASNEAARPETAPPGWTRRIESWPTATSARFRWALTLLSSLQLKHFLTSSPSDEAHDARQLSVAPPPPTRAGYRAFARLLLVKTVCVYLLLDATSYAINDSWLGFARGIARMPPAQDESLPEKAGRALLMMTHLGAALALYTGFLPLLLATAALLPFPNLQMEQWCSPYLATPHFGPISSIWGGGAGGSRHTDTSASASSAEDVSSSDSRSRSGRIWGLRAFWGRFWHGNMRHYTSSPSIALCDALHLSQRSQARYLVVVCGAFFFSGLVHAGMVPPSPLHTSLSALVLRVRIAGFFWLQVPGIALEAALDPLLHFSWGAGKKAAAAAWFVAYFAGTMYVTALPVGRELGWWSCPAVPVSLVRWAAGRRQWWEGVDWEGLLEKLAGQE